MQVTLDASLAQGKPPDSDPRHRLANSVEMQRWPPGRPVRGFPNPRFSTQQNKIMPPETKESPQPLCGECDFASTELCRQVVVYRGTFAMSGRAAKVHPIKPGVQKSHSLRAENNHPPAHNGGSRWREAGFY
jgi:hypothetical protein